MIQKNEPLSSKDFKKGLVTRSDILNPDPEQSPNCMDVKWFFDGALGKRPGATTTNSVILTQTGNFSSWVIDQNASLSTNLLDYWKLDEGTAPYLDSFGTNNLLTVGSASSVPGLRGNAVQFGSTGYLLSSNNSLIDIGTANFTIALWVYANTFSAAGNYTLVQLGSFNSPFFSVIIQPASPQIGVFATSNGSTVATLTASFAALSTATWNSIIAWRSNGSHIGISVNGAAANSATFTGAIGGPASVNSSNFARFGFDQRTVVSLDEIGFWNKVLSASERTDIYGGSSGNTFSTGTSNLNSWASFDFGATSIRWYTVAVGTGIVASSNLGVSFVSVSTSRTQAYQYFERSKNVLIATSDAQDPTLYWAGSVGTFANALAPGSAPQAKYSINYQGFLILLNGVNRPRGFFYADENLQLTDPWTSSFDYPSSADDEITCAFVLSKFLYVSTRYRIFFTSFVGGNPDWTFRKVKDWGFVPRTVGIATIKGSQVAIGMDWQRRVRVFDGYDDLFVSDSIENYNGACEFATTRISYAGSGLIVSHAAVDQVEQEYRLNVAIGAGSTQVTHAILLNLRTLAMFPYSNQNYNTICIAESANQQHLMAVDRSGFVHILNSGNLDVKKPISEVYDSPILFKGIPGTVSKSMDVTLYFKSDSCGQVYYQDALNRSSTMSAPRQLVNLTGTESVVQVEAPLDIPATFNTYQFRVISSGSTANPWKASRWDFLQDTKGIGKG